jgi:superfamily II DNA/RNA helicase
LNFQDFGLDSRILEGIEAMGYTKATPVQEQVIPLIMQGKDVMASAQTGTGKTAAFLLPVVHQLISMGLDNSVKALVIEPTRELAVQIDQQMEGLSYFTHISSIAVYGGTDGASFSREKQALTEGADIIIGTPGRLIAHLNMGYVNISSLKCLVLDEADRMLDMGFYEDIMKIISYLPEKRQNLLFAATMPVKIREMIRKVMSNPLEVNIAVSKPAEKVLQVAYLVYENQKVALVKHLLQGKKLRSVIIFCSTKSKAKILSKELKVTGSVLAEIHSDLDQKERETVLMKFKNRSVNILVATDILSRGIDVEDIDLVVNYDVPNDGEDYIHRIGRTARAEAEGIAITLIGEKDQRKFQQIEQMLGKPIMKSALPAHLGEAPANHPERSGGTDRKRFGGKGERRNSTGRSSGRNSGRR